MSNRPKSSLSPALGAMQASLQTHGLARALRPHLAKARWAEIVGPQVAGVTQIERIQREDEGGAVILVVRVRNSVWANELTLLKGDILRRLNLALGGRVLTDIRFKASGLTREKSEKPPKIPAQTPVLGPDELQTIPLGRAAQERIQTATAGISDNALRVKIQKSLERAAKTDAWQREQGWTPCRKCGALAPEILCAVCRALTKN